MANRPKTERNQKIWDYYKKGYRYQSIANIYKMKISAVGMVITRMKKQETIPEYHHTAPS